MTSINKAIVLTILLLNQSVYSYSSENKVTKIAIFGSSMSMGYPYSGLSWIDALDKTLNSRHKQYDITKFVSYDMSIHKMIEFEENITKISPDIAIFQISASDALIEDYRKQGELLPTLKSDYFIKKFLSDSNKSSLEKKVPSFNKSNFEDFLIRLSKNCKIYLIGPCAWKKNLEPIGNDIKTNDQSLDLELKALEELAQKSERDSPEYALKCYKRMCELAPNQARFHFLYAACARKNGFLAEATLAYLKACEMDQIQLRGKINEVIQLKNISKNKNITYFDYQKLINALDHEKLADGTLFYDATHPRLSAVKILCEALIIEIFGSKVYKTNKNYFESLDWRIDDKTLWKNVAHFFMTVEKYQYAIKVLDHLLQSDNHQMDVLQMMLKAARSENDFRRSLAACSLILKNNPYHESTWNEWILLKHERQPLNDLDQIFKVLPFPLYQTSIPLAVDGMNYLHLNNFDLAKEKILKAYQLNSQHPFIQSSRLALAIRTGDQSSIDKWIRVNSHHLIKEDRLYTKAVQWVDDLWESPTQLKNLISPIKSIYKKHQNKLNLGSLIALLHWRFEQWNEASQLAQEIKQTSVNKNIPINLDVLDTIISLPKSQLKFEYQDFQKWCVDPIL